MDKSLIAALLLFPLVALGQTHTFPGNNVFPSTSTTDFNAGATVDFTGATVTGLPAGGAVTWGTITGTLSAQTDLNTALTGKQPLDTDLTNIAALTTTSFGRSFLTQADAAASRTYIGAGTSSFDQTAADALYSPLAHSHTFASLTSKPTTFFGYSISDSSASLRTSLTDENGTGAALFNGATTPNFTTGITIDSAAASGKILQGDGTDFAGSTPTWPTAAGTSGYTVRSDGSNFASYPQVLLNSSVTNQTPGNTEVYLAGSNVTVAAGDFKAKGQYRCVFDLVKSAGTGALVIALKTGNNGNTTDTTRITFTFGAGTGVADTGSIEVIINWRTVGGGTSAVISGFCRAQHNLANTGLWANVVSSTVIVGTVSSGFNSTADTAIGLAITGGTAFAGTITTVQAQLIQ